MKKLTREKGYLSLLAKIIPCTYLLSIFLWIIGSVALFIANTKKCCISVYISSWIFYLVSFLILFYVDRTIQREENFFFQKNKNKSNEEKWSDGFRKRLSENNINSKDFPYIIKYYEEKINHEEKLRYFKHSDYFISLLWPLIISLVSIVENFRDEILAFSLIGFIIVPIFSFIVCFSLNQKRNQHKRIIYYLKLALLDEEYTKRG